VLNQTTILNNIKKIKQNQTTSIKKYSANTCKCWRYVFTLHCSYFLLKVITKGGGKRPDETLATLYFFKEGATFYQA